MVKSATATILALLAACAPADDRFEGGAEQMLAEIERTVQQTAARTGLAKLNPAVLAAMKHVPRHEFVPRALAAEAYRNSPLPIGEGQTISQPYIVALMTHLAEVDADSRVLEIGTGSGYQAAVLGELAGEVYSIEIIESLGRRAEGVLQRLGYDNVHVRIGDGYAGWPEQAPFDAIVVTAAPDEVPQPLIEQLKVGGRLVVPVGPRRGAQQLKVLVMQDDGTTLIKDVLPVAFVPFIRDQP